MTPLVRWRHAERRPHPLDVAPTLMFTDDEPKLLFAIVSANPAWNPVLRQRSTAPSGQCAPHSAVFTGPYARSGWRSSSGIGCPRTGGQRRRSCGSWKPISAKSPPRSRTRRWQFPYCPALGPTKRQGRTLRFGIRQLHHSIVTIDQIASRPRRSGIWSWKRPVPPEYADRPRERDIRRSTFGGTGGEHRHERRRRRDRAAETPIAGVTSSVDRVARGASSIDCAPCFLIDPLASRPILHRCPIRVLHPFGRASHPSPGVAQSRRMDSRPSACAQSGAPSQSRSRSDRQSRIPPVRFGRVQRCADARQLWNTNDMQEKETGFGDRMSRRGGTRNPRGLQAVATIGQ